MNRISSETVLCRPFQATRQHRIQTSGEVQINSCKRKLWVGRSPIYVLLPLGHSWLLSFAVTFKFLSAFLLCHMFSSWSPFLFITCVCFFSHLKGGITCRTLLPAFPFCFLLLPLKIIAVYSQSTKNDKYIGTSQSLH